MCTFGVLGLSCASPGGPVWWGRRGFTRQPKSPNVRAVEGKGGPGEEGSREVQTSNNHNHNNAKPRTSGAPPPLPSKVLLGTTTQQHTTTTHHNTPHHNTQHNTTKQHTTTHHTTTQQNNTTQNNNTTTTTTEHFAKTLKLAKVGLAEVGHDQMYLTVTSLHCQCLSWLMIDQVNLMKSKPTKT